MIEYHLSSGSGGMADALDSGSSGSFILWEFKSPLPHCLKKNLCYRDSFFVLSRPARLLCASPLLANQTRINYNIVTLISREADRNVEKD